MPLVHRAAILLSAKRSAQSLIKETSDIRTAAGIAKNATNFRWPLETHVAKHLKVKPLGRYVSLALRFLQERCWRNSVGDRPKMRLNMRLNWVSDWKPTS